MYNGTFAESLQHQKKNRVSRVERCPIHYVLGRACEENIFATSLEKSWLFEDLCRSQAEMKVTTTSN